MKTRYPPLYRVSWWCETCRRWISATHITVDQIHDRASGGCGNFVHVEISKPIRGREEYGK